MADDRADATAAAAAAVAVGGCAEEARPTADSDRADGTAAVAVAAAGTVAIADDTIATRTRTKLSLVDVPIDTLEADLPDADALDQLADHREEDHEYQRFLWSLLPHEQEDLGFLDEEDEEYRPDDDVDADDHEDEDEDDVRERRRARRGISKRELTDLLLDSTQMHLPVVAASAPSIRKVAARSSMDSVDTSVIVSPAPPLSAGMTPMPTARSVAGMTASASVSARRAANFRGLHGAATQSQCIQLASQMHKHLQLLLQSYHLLAAGSSPSPSLAECRAMIHELQQRGEKALRYKNALLAKLQPTTPSASRTPATVASTTTAEPSTDVPKGQSETADLLALRRVTRSLTAAHAAVAHPSMFELVGSQTVDELAAGFTRGCSLEERDRAMQEQMLQLDAHLLAARPGPRKTGRAAKRPKTGCFAPSEDELLAHGAKRFGVQPNSWPQIRRHFLPRKSEQMLRHRYKYLTSCKTGMSTVKALHHQVPQRRDVGWRVEEDLRIARGLVALHGEKKRFSRLAKEYLPHRSRLEIRKRWGRLGAKFRAEVTAVGLSAPEPNSLDLTVAMKAYLEGKLRDRVRLQSEEIEIAKMDAALQLRELGRELRQSGELATGAGARTGARTGETKEDGVASCKSKNLHPALFFTSWSFISPATLLNSTCKHNWPAFIDEDKQKPTESSRATTAPQSTGLTTPTTASSMLNCERITTARQKQPSSVDTGQPKDVLLGVPTPATTVDAAMPLAASLISTESAMEVDNGGHPRSEVTSVLSTSKTGGSEDDDSDYEHDELLSSESDSEFEQIELSDDEDEEEGSVDADGDGFEQDTLLSDSDEQSVDSAESLWTPRTLTPAATPSPGPTVVQCLPVSASSSSPVHHPLRLKNLRQPGNERTKRALDALERRIVGRGLGTAASNAHTAGPNQKKRVKRRVVSTLVKSVTPSVVEDDGDDEDDVDWEDGSGDEGFEVDELLESSDEELSSVDDGHDVRSHHGKRHDPDPTTELPSKKLKLQRCATCDHVSCCCSSNERMRQLLRRMREKRSSSSLQ